MVEVVKSKKIQAAPEPTEYEGAPIIARLLVAEEDIERLTSTKATLSLKLTFFDEYARGTYIDVIFLSDAHDSTIYRYRMVSKSDTAINFRLACKL